MKDKEIVKAGHAGFVHSKKQAKFVLHQVYSIYSWQSLLELTNHWLDKMPQAVIVEFETLARTIGDTNDWPLGHEDKPFTDEREMNRQKAALFLILFQYYYQGWLLAGKNIHEKKTVTWKFTEQQEPFRILANLSKCAPFRLLLKLMFQCLEAATSKEYMDRFNATMKDRNPETEESYNELRDDPYLGQHADLMIIFGNLRLLLDALHYLSSNPQ